MTASATKISAILASIPGAADIKVEQTAGLPVLTVGIDRQAIARYGLNISDVQEVVSMAMGGSKVGQVFEGDRRFDLVVRLPDEVRRDIHALENLAIPLPMSGASTSSVRGSAEHPAAHAAYVPLGAVAKIALPQDDINNPSCYHEMRVDKNP